MTLLGALLAQLSIAPKHWLAAIRANLAPKLHKLNEQSFSFGRMNVFHSAGTAYQS